jgi:4-amino-4-deoxy-L-arabinose transferase-like glycosyltransferase
MLRISPALRMDLLAAIPGAAICTVLMLPMLTSLPLVLDEHGTWWITGDGPLNLWRRSLEYENIPPLAPAIHWLFISILGKSEFAFRLPVALLTIAAVIVTSLVGTRFSDRRLGLIAGIVLALHPDVLNETRIARCYALSLLLAALLLLAVLKWLRYPTRPGGPLLWTITASGLVWTHYLNFPVVAISLIMLLLSVRIPVTSHRGWLLLPIGITGISILPLLPAIYRMFVWGSLFEFQQSATLNEVLSGMWWCGLPLALTLRLFIRSTRVDPESSRCSHQIIWLTVLFVGLPTLATLGCTIAGSFSLTAPRYRTAIQPVAAICWAYWATRGLRLSRSLPLLTCCLTAVWLCQTAAPWTPIRLQTRQANQWKRVAMYLNQHISTAEPIFVQSGLGDAWLLAWMHEDTVLHDFVGCRCGRFYLPTANPRFGLPMHWEINPDIKDWYQQQLQELRRQKQGLWIAVAIDTDLNIQSALVFTRLVSDCGFQQAEYFLQQDVSVMRFIPKD